MLKIYPQILGFLDKIEEWNEKLNAFTAEHMDNALVGAIIVIVLMVIAVWGIGVLNKK